ncbi:MAG: methylated-DNA--[protein]-cysteine S-methyltransferase [Alphaproteobacteria bacterium]|nr:MAG: methylated-DNA--[protein]-cysteine S-methyltransferase [Alphaproteobacteria bacterium]
MKALAQHQLETPLGPMLAISDEQNLYLLEFLDKKNLLFRHPEVQPKGLPVRKTRPIISIEQELQSYFFGTLKTFKTPFHLGGTEFQNSTWSALLQIPYGTTKSYKEQAHLMNQPSACRAVANANGANQLAIIVPCHRIVQSGGAIGGYAAGAWRKKWLLEHEAKHR